MTAIGMSFLLTRIWYVVKGYRILEPLLTCCGYQKSNSHLECVHQLSKANILAAQQCHHCSIEWLIRFHVASVRPLVTYGLIYIQMNCGKRATNRRTAVHHSFFSLKFSIHFAGMLPYHVSYMGIYKIMYSVLLAKVFNLSFSFLFCLVSNVQIFNVIITSGLKCL